MAKQYTVTVRDFCLSICVGRLHEALLKCCRCFCVTKVRLNGLTGRVAFDSRGHRTDYQLAVIELRYNTLPRKVSYFTLQYFVLVLILITSITTTTTSTSSSSSSSSNGSAMATTTCLRRRHRTHGS